MKNVNKKIGIQFGLLAAVLMLATVPARAAQVHGFFCGTFDRELMVRVYQPLLQTHAQTHKGSVMSLIDPTVEQGKQVIGTLQDTDINQTRTGLEFAANAIHAIPGPVPYINGIPLKQVQWVILGINLATAKPAQNGEIVQGTLRVQKTNGQVYTKLVTCSTF